MATLFFEKFVDNIGSFSDFRMIFNDVKTKTKIEFFKNYNQDQISKLYICFKDEVERLSTKAVRFDLTDDELSDLNTIVDCTEIFNNVVFTDYYVSLSEFLVVPSFHKSVQLKISSLCIQLWKTNCVGASKVIINLIPFLLSICAAADAKEADFKRLYDVRGGFKLFDLSTKSSLLIHELILKAVVQPCVVYRKERGLLISFLLALEDGHVLDYVRNSIKLLLLQSSSAAATFLATVLSDIWRKHVGSVEDRRLCLKVEELIQDLLIITIHCGLNKQFLNLRNFHLAFVDGSRDNDIHCVLKRLYAPAILRSLNCANAVVRANSTVLFFDIFPIHDMSGSAEDDDRLLQRQFDYFSSLLVDEDHRVRCSAIRGGCHVLISYWHLMPVETIKAILSHLVRNLSCDLASADVRSEVLRGVGDLLEQQPLSHTSLRKLIPFLSRSISDSSEKVRIMAVEFLGKVAKIRDIHFYDVIPHDVIMAQMTVDANHPRLTSAFTGLLLNSFFPSAALENANTNAENSTIQDELHRCINFIKLNSRAAVVFYGNFQNHVSLGRVIKFVVVLSSFVLKHESDLQMQNTKVVSSKRSRVQQQDCPVTLDSRSKSVMRKIVMIILLNLKVESLGPDSVTLLRKYFSVESINKAVSISIANGDEDAVTVWLRIAATAFLTGKDVKSAKQGVKQTEEGGYFNGDDSVVVRIFKMIRSLNEKSALTVYLSVVDSIVSSLNALGCEAFILQYVVNTVRDSRNSVSEIEMAGDVLVALSRTMVLAEYPNVCCRDDILQLTESIPSIGAQRSVSVAKLITSCSLNLGVVDKCHPTAMSSYECNIPRVLTWIQDNVMILLSTDVPASEMKGVIGMSLFVLGDIIYMGIRDVSATRLITNWLELLQSYLTNADSNSSKGGKNAEKCLLSSLAVPLCRILTFLVDCDTINNFLWSTEEEQEKAGMCTARILFRIVDAEADRGDVDVSLNMIKMISVLISKSSFKERWFKLTLNYILEQLQSVWCSGSHIENAISHCSTWSVNLLIEQSTQTLISNVSIENDSFSSELLSALKLYVCKKRA